MTDALFVVFFCTAGFLLAYFVYSRFLADRILGLNPSRRTPAHALKDGKDFWPTKKSVLFGHHFASIAGLGPIMGPAIAVIWGWLPALLWVFFGSIFLGAVHDFTCLWISMRHEGRSVGDVAKEVMGGRARILFLFLIFFLIALAMGVFVLVIAQLFVSHHPEAALPSFSLILIAVVIGLLIYKTRLGLVPATLIGLGLMFISIWIGVNHVPSVYKAFVPEKVLSALEHGIVRGEISERGLAKEVETAKPAAYNCRQVKEYFAAKGEAEIARSMGEAERRTQSFWTITLLLYALLASVLPVWILLQPRDYLNSYQLYLGLFGIYIGLLLLRPSFQAPPVNSSAFAGDAPSLFPFLFITVACGAISGFHSLVSSGTTAKQIDNERDSRIIGYGGMLLEGLLAVLVITACCAGFASEADWSTHYSSWSAAGGLGKKLSAFVDGAGLFISQAGLPIAYAKALIAVVVVGFAMTTLDSGTRLLRYNIEEIGHSLKIRPLQNRYLAALIAVAAVGFFAFMKIKGKPAGLVLWQLFGTTNQLMAGMGLLTVSIYLFMRRKPTIYTLLPMVFMLVVTISAMVIKLQTFWRKENWMLLGVGGAILLLAVWLALEAFLSLMRLFRARAQEKVESVRKA
jgi:carbon starvation protein